jgi:hypothetical protein
VIVLLCISAVSCSSIFGPSEDSDGDDDSDDTEEARIIIYNYYGENLDFYLDGLFQFTLSHDGDDKIRDVTLDEHFLEAKKEGTTTIVASTEIDVTSYTDYSWQVDDPPDINVTNQYGVKLKIYMDENYLFDLVDEEDRWIVNVSFGEHFLKALRASDDKEIASTTIDVDENEDYSWTIE